LGVVALLCMVQTAQAFDVTLPPPPPKAVERQDVVPIGSRIMRRLTVTLVEPGAGTLQAAYDAASAGDVLELKDGTYTGSDSNVLEISKDVTIRAQNAQMAVLDGQDERRVVYITGGTVVLEGLAITRGKVVRARLVPSLNVHPLPRWMTFP
jgi:hypothetical protein